MSDSSVDPGTVPFRRKAPYQFFVDDNIATITASNPGSTDQQIQRLLAVAHAASTREQRAAFIARAEAQEVIDRAARDAASAAWKLEHPSS